MDTCLSKTAHGHPKKYGCTRFFVKKTLMLASRIVQSVEQHCAIQDAQIQTKIQHTLSDLLFNISAPLLSPA